MPKGRWAGAAPPGDRARPPVPRPALFRRTFLKLAAAVSRLDPPPRGVRLPERGPRVGVLGPGRDGLLQEGARGREPPHGEADEPAAVERRGKARPDLQRMTVAGEGQCELAIAAHCLGGVVGAAVAVLRGGARDGLGRPGLVDQRGRARGLCHGGAARRQNRAGEERQRQQQRVTRHRAAHCATRSDAKRPDLAQTRRHLAACAPSAIAIPARFQLQCGTQPFSPTGRRLGDDPQHPFRFKKIRIMQEIAPVSHLLTLHTHTPIAITVVRWRGRVQRAPFTRRRPPLARAP